MKKGYIIAICATVLTVMVLCGGCASAMQKLDDGEIRQCAESMLDALIGDDPQSAYALGQGNFNEADFASAFTKMQEFLGDTDTYDLKLLSIYKNSTIQKGQKTSVTRADYEMIAKNEKIIVSIQTIGPQHALDSFYLTPYQHTNYSSTGTVQRMEGADGVQWAVLLSNVLILGFTLFALVDCCRHRIRKKVLWILFLIFGFVSVGLTLSSSGLRLNFNVGWLSAYSALIRYGSGRLLIRVMLPMGAISYWLARRSLLDTPAPAVTPSEITPEQQSAGTESDP